MKFRHRLALVPALAALGVALALPTLAAADPAGTTPFAEGKEVVSVTPIEGAPTAEETRAAFAAQEPDRQVMIGADGKLLLVEDSDYTSASSRRRIAGASALAERPSAFDLRDATFPSGSGRFTTVVKSQSPFGACWAFAVASAAESSIHSEHLGPVADGNELDLSEKQLAWFGFNPLDASFGDQAGEGLQTTLDPATESGEFYDVGGNFSMATTLFSAGIGPAEESVDPALEYRNAEGTYDEYPNDEDVPTYDGDWSVPEPLRQVSGYELEESFYLPSPASYEYDEASDAYRYVYNQAGVDAIKDQLLAGHGVALGFCADLSMPGQPSEARYLNTDTWAHYTYESPQEGAEGGAPNHAVCIVGYDDAYSRTNFNPDHMPEGDGAFIVKNNWGSLQSPYGMKGDWGIDGTGYFYLSYYDKSIQELEAYDFVTPDDADLSYGTDPEDGDHTVYTHAYLPQTPTPDVYDDVTSMAEVFEVEGPSVVRSVSVQTHSFDTDVRFDVYRLRDGATEPTDGTLLWSRDERFAVGGFHRIELEAPIVVEDGDRIAVVVTTRLPDGTYELVQNSQVSRLYADITCADPDDPTKYWAETAVNDGESFFGSPSSTVEFSDGSYAYGGYDWFDFTSVAEDRDKALEIVDELGIPALIEERDAAFAELSALDADDPRQEEVQTRLDEAQDALNALVDECWNDAFLAFTAYDNYAITLTTEPIDPADPPVEATVSMWRLYNPHTGEHLYTSDANERQVLTGLGWEDEGLGWTSPRRSNTPVHRLFNPHTEEHLYTTNAVEWGTLTGLGWRDEGIAFYSDNLRETPVYRLYNAANPEVASHHFTTDRAERDALIAKHGWRDESIAWYGK